MVDTDICSDGIITACFVGIKNDEDSFKLGGVDFDNDVNDCDSTGEFVGKFIAKF